LRRSTFFCIFAKNIKCYSLKKGIKSFLTNKSQETNCNPFIYKTRKNSKKSSLSFYDFYYSGYFCLLFVSPVVRWCFFVHNVEELTLKPAISISRILTVSRLFLVKKQSAIFILLHFVSFCFTAVWLFEFIISSLQSI